MRGSRPEARFLPAALAVEETPPRRAARALLYAVVLFCGVAIAWAMGADVATAWRCHVDQASITRVIFRDRVPVLAGFNQMP